MRNVSDWCLVCSHNLTGCGSKKEQLENLVKLRQEKDGLAFFDVAYRGFASGFLTEDAHAPRLFAKNGMEFLVAQSYSKNLGIYVESIGALHFVLNDDKVRNTIATLISFL